MELKLISSFPQHIVGVDEAGRGPLCGPVVVGAVSFVAIEVSGLKHLLKRLKQIGVTDSKQISPLGRKKVLEKIGVCHLDFGRAHKIKFLDMELNYCLTEMSAAVIDDENVLAASLRGMKEASLLLSEKINLPTTVLIDGNQNLRWDKKKSPFHEIPLIGGDQKSRLIGLASILAKEKRDAVMQVLHQQFPDYGMNTHFGYPTKAHREAIKKFGPSPIHRKTFRGVKEYINRDSSI